MDNGSGLSLCGRYVFPEDTPQETTSESTDLMLQDTPVFYRCKYDMMACKITNNHAVKKGTTQKTQCTCNPEGIAGNANPTL